MGICAPFAPISLGPSGVFEEENGTMLKEAPVSTKKFNLLLLSLRNNKPEPCEKGHRRCCVNLDGLNGGILPMRRLLYWEDSPFPCQLQGEMHL